MLGTIVLAAQQEIASQPDPSFTPITWMLITLVGVLIGMMWNDLNKKVTAAYSRAHHHGHKVALKCDKGCIAEVETKGVLLSENGDEE